MFRVAHADSGGKGGASKGKGTSPKATRVGTSPRATRVGAMSVRKTATAPRSTRV